jgi:glycosyltransferase involved in cell wall biosynthesis
MTNNSEYRFTVFTPTYERAHVLHRPYETLQQQTHEDFEWLIIDDNSTDETQSLVESWKKEADFPIRFVTQDKDQPGKHHAFNTAVDIARGELFYEIDSDDELLPDALEILSETWESIAPEDRDQYAGVTGLCIDTNRNVVGDRFPDSPFDSDSIELRYRYKISGEKSGMIRTDILQEYPFPELEGVRHVPESLVWDAISGQYKTRFVNEPLRVYHIDDSVSQLTTDGDTSKSSMGHVLARQDRLNSQLSWARYAPLEFLKSATQYVRYANHTGLTVSEQAKRLRWPAHLLWLACLPVGTAAATLDRR